MLVRDYLKNFDQYKQVTFIKARARKDAHTPGYHPEYQTTPIRTIQEYRDSKVMDCYLLNTKQCPIDWMSGAPWANDFNAGRLISLLVISDEDIKLLYSEKQAMDTIAYIDTKIQEELKKK